MPQYYTIPDWQKRGRVELIPDPLLRRFPILKRVLPYHVGDKVRFHVHFEKPHQDFIPLTSHVLWEKIGGKWRPLSDVNATDTEIVGNRIHSTGDVAYCLGRPDWMDISDIVFTTEVENWDAVFSKWAWTIIGMILSFIVGILLWALGIIQIIPRWNLIVK